MDLPSMVSEFGKMAVTHSAQDPSSDRKDSATPSSMTSDRAAPGATSEVTAAKRAGRGSNPRRSRTKAISAYRKPNTTDFKDDSQSPSTGTSDSENLSPSKATISPLKATAAEFVPSPLKPQDDPKSKSSSRKPPATPLFTIAPSARGGVGVFTTQDIPMGTRIMSDSPLLKIPTNELYLVYGPYRRLGNAQKELYDSLYYREGRNFELEQASRMYLLDPTDVTMDSDDEEEFVADHVRVMGIFAVNNFLMANGELGIFPNAARLNHSCVPNVHHSYNSTLNQLTVHAMRDIRQGQELLMNYIGTDCHFWSRDQRWAYLRSKYGFTCLCQACSDTTGTSDNRHEAVQVLIWGIEEFQKREPKGTCAVIPDSGVDALAQAEDIISLLLEQELLAVELLRAYRLASSLALDTGDYQRALEYASNEAEIEKNIFGSELDDLKKNGTASELWIQSLYRILEAKDYLPYPKLAVKIFDLTGVRHEVLDYKGPKKAKGTYKKYKKSGTTKKENGSPKKNGNV